MGDSVLTIGLGFFSRIKQILGRTETRTRDRIYCQTIRSVRDIYRDDRAIIATCTLRTPTDRNKENYSIDAQEMIVIVTCSCRNNSVSTHCAERFPGQSNDIVYVRIREDSTEEKTNKSMAD